MICLIFKWSQNVFDKRHWLIIIIPSVNLVVLYFFYCIFFLYIDYIIFFVINNLHLIFVSFKKHYKKLINGTKINRTNILTIHYYISTLHLFLIQCLCRTDKIWRIIIYCLYVNVKSITMFIVHVLISLKHSPLQILD